MKTFLAVIVSVCTSLLLSANLENSWQDKVKGALHPIQTKKFVLVEKVYAEKGANREAGNELKEQSPAEAYPPPTPSPETPIDTPLNPPVMSSLEKPEGSLTISEIIGLLEVPALSNLKALVTDDRIFFLREKGAPVKEIASAKRSLSTSTKKKIREQLKKQAIELGLEPSLAISMAKVESGYDPRAVSPKGAVGVLQVMPLFAWEDHRVERERLFDPEVNIRIGLSRIKSLLNRFNQDLDLSLAAYNAGASRVVRAGYKIPSIEETQAYVRKVKEAMENEV